MFDRSTDLSVLRNRSFADAQAWRARLEGFAQRVDENRLAAYRPDYPNLTTPQNAIARGANFSIVGPLEPYFLPMPCTGASHLHCNAAAVAAAQLWGAVATVVLAAAAAADAL